MSKNIPSVKKKTIKTGNECRRKQQIHLFSFFFQSSLNGNDSFKPQESVKHNSPNVLIDHHEGKSVARLLGETLAGCRHRQETWNQPSEVESQATEVRGSSAGEERWGLADPCNMFVIQKTVQH